MHSSNMESGINAGKDGSHIPGESNPADLFTKILSRQLLEKHRKVTLNLPGDTGIEYARRAARDVSSQRDGTSAP